MKDIVKQTKYLLIALVIVGLQSCIKSRDEYYPMVIGTIQIEAGNVATLYFELDSGYKLFPKNPENIVVNKLKANDRVFIQFTDPDENSTKKELKANIKMILNIDTQDIEFTQDENSANALIQESERINIIEAYIANGFLTLKYSYLGQHNVSDHSIKLYATQESKVEDNKTLKLYLTHAAKGNQNTYVNTGIICFPIQNISEQVEVAEKIYINAKTIYSGVQETPIYIVSKNQ